MNRQMKRFLNRYRRDERGNVAIIFGLALLPIMGLTGASIDYSRSSQLRAKMGVAADAAVLVAVKSNNLTLAQRQAAANAAFNANLGADASLVSVSGTLTKLTGNAYRYEATANYNYSVIQVVPGMGSYSQLSVAAEANAGDGKLEVALVLDNTGSMNSDMQALRTAARDFTNILFDSAGGGTDLKMSVVPYVAAVNPGRMNLGMSSIDTRGESDWQARNLRWRWIGFIPNCNNDPYWVPGPPGGPWTPPDTGTPGNGASLQDALRKFADIGRELFGVKSAAAQVGTYGTPNRTAPFLGNTITVDPPYTSARVTGKVPAGFNYDATWAKCVLSNPGQIANLDLFDGIATRNGRAQWKGCVEARPEPFDVTDDPPTAGDPRTRFSPYFWPDEPGQGNRGNSLGYVNNYMDDGTTPAPFSNNGWEWEWQANLFKYDGVNRNVNFSENPPNTSGPNMACPDELLRLTNNRATVLSKISGLSHWNGGGTISSEGIMWGWRTLSPKLPFADGVPYRTEGNKKVLVVMTDGENEIGGNNPGGPVMSHYNAYGYMRWGRFPTENFQRASQYLDSRMLQACTNAKAEGIQVITILFRVNTANSRNLLRSCATSGQLFYIASNTAELQEAFTKIAETIGKIRLSK